MQIVISSENLKRIKEKNRKQKKTIADALRNKTCVVTRQQKS